MEIRKTDATAFGATLHVKTDQQEVLDLLENLSGDWNPRPSNSIAAYSTNGSVPTDEFTHVMVDDGEHIARLHELKKRGGFSPIDLATWRANLGKIGEGAQEVVVRSVEELKKLPFFAKHSIDIGEIINFMRHSRL